MAINDSTFTKQMIHTKICNRIDDLSAWMASNVILEKGEIALAIVTYTDTNSNGQFDSSEGNTYPADQAGVHGVPTVMIKVGDGTSTFANLKWVAAPASDVYAWAKLPTVDAALGTSKEVIPTINALLAGLDKDKDGYENVVEAIQTAVAGLSLQYNSTNNDNGHENKIITSLTISNTPNTTNKTITTSVNATYDYITDDYFGDATYTSASGDALVGDYKNSIPMKRIAGLTKYHAGVDAQLETINGMLQDSGKVMEFIGTIDTKTNLDIDCADGWFGGAPNATGAHQLQKGDVVATTSDAKEYIWTKVPSGSEITPIHDGYYWEEFGHASATDEALAQLRTEVETFAEQIDANGLDYRKGDKDTVTARIGSLESFQETAEEQLTDLYARSALYVAAKSIDGSDAGTETGGDTDVPDQDYLAINGNYIIFNCGTAAIRGIDRFTSST